MTEEIPQSSPLLQQIDTIVILKGRVERNYARILAEAVETDLSSNLVLKLSEIEQIEQPCLSILDSLTC